MDNKAALALRRLLRSMDLPHMRHDRFDAAQAGRVLLEELGMPVRENGQELIKRAEELELYPYRDAQRYGDCHPIGTFTIDVDLNVAMFLEKRFSLTAGNAPDGYDVTDIHNDPKGEGMEVSVEGEEEDEFITLTLRDQEAVEGRFTVMVGPARLKDVVEALEGFHATEMQTKAKKS